MHVEILVLLILIHSLEELTLHLWITFLSLRFNSMPSVVMNFAYEDGIFLLLIYSQLTVIIIKHTCSMSSTTSKREKIFLLINYSEKCFCDILVDLFCLHRSYNYFHVWTR